jgi:hypothetical protein
VNRTAVAAPELGEMIGFGHALGAPVDVLVGIGEDIADRVMTTSCNSSRVAGPLHEHLAETTTRTDVVSIYSTR